MTKLTFKERQWERREQEIITCTADLLRQYGVEGVNLDKLAEAVGISKPTLYQHFRSKEDLIARVILIGMQALEEQIIQNSVGTPIERLERLCHGLLHLSIGKNSALAGMTHEAVRCVMKFPEVATYKAQMHAKINQLIEAGKAQGQIVPDLITPIIIQSMFSLRDSLGRVLEDHPELEQDRDQAIDNIVHIFINGITP